jgi:hypothetical protein
MYDLDVWRERLWWLARTVLLLVVAYAMVHIVLISLVKQLERDGGRLLSPEAKVQQELMRELGGR